MAYPDTFENCVELEQITAIDNVVDYGLIQSMLNQSKIEICECSNVSATQIKVKLDVIEGGIRQLINEVIDEVNETQTIVKTNTGTDFTIMI